MLKQILTLGLAVALALTGCTRQKQETLQQEFSPEMIQATSSGKTFKNVFADAFLVGTAVSAEQIQENQAVQKLVAEQFSALTAENDMKWGELQPDKGPYNWEVADKIVAFAVKNNIHLTGHALLWHQQAPEWIFIDEQGEPASRELLLKRLQTHIHTIMTRYKGKVASWDVVNEALNEDGTMRESLWYKLIGPDYVEKAFEYAHQADPTARLYYNDYNMFKPEKRAGAVALIKRVKAAGNTVHGIGLQGHYGIGYPKDLSEIEDSIIAFSEIVDEVLITELDLSALPFPDEGNEGADVSLDMALNDEYNPYVDGLPADIEAQLNQQYVDLFRIFLKHKDKISRVTFWGVDDGQSWRNYWPMAGRTDYPLLIGRNLKLKSGAYKVFKLVDQY